MQVFCFARTFWWPHKKPRHRFFILADRRSAQHFSHSHIQLEFLERPQIRNSWNKVLVVTLRWWWRKEKLPFSPKAWGGFMSLQIRLGMHFSVKYMHWTSVNECIRSPSSLTGSVYASPSRVSSVFKCVSYLLMNELHQQRCMLMVFMSVRQLFLLAIDFHTQILILNGAYYVRRARVKEEKKTIFT